MSFREIRPSLGEGSASTNGSQSLSISESTGSDLHQARAGRKTDSNRTTSKRRRVPDTVTKNACLGCKKARAKV
jgi:hypothetical protein